MGTIFLLVGTEKALLIDSGMNTLNAKQIAESITKLPIILLNTHADLITSQEMSVLIISICI